MVGKYDELRRDAIASIVEKSLLESSPEALAEVTHRLDSYGLSFSDCLDNPDKLAPILKETLAEGYADILNSMDERIKDLSQNPETDNFVKILKKFAPQDRTR